MKPFVIVFLLFLALHPTSVFSQPPQDFLLFYSNDVNGEIEPCG